jgi:uncharacterized membrane protein
MSTERRGCIGPALAAWFLLAVLVIALVETFNGN